MDALLQKKGIKNDGDLQLKFLKLLCQFEPESCLGYLKSQVNYRFDECLELCKKYNISDAVSYLLERTGDVVGALEYYLVVSVGYCKTYKQNLRNKLDLLKAKLVAQAKIVDPENNKYLGLESFDFINEDKDLLEKCGFDTKKLPALPPVTGSCKFCFSMLIL